VDQCRPKHTQRKGKTPVLNVDEARTLIAAIDTTSLPGLRDRALIALMVYTFARVGAAVAMKVEDFFVQGRRGWVRLHEKGGKEHEMPTHHNLDRYLEEYIAAAGIAQDRKGPLFRTSKGRGGELADRPLLQSKVWRMIRRRAAEAGIETEIGCHTFRATGITAYLRNGGRLEVAQQMAAHESARTTAPLASMIGVATRFLSMRLSASGFEPAWYSTVALALRGFRRSVKKEQTEPKSNAVWFLVSQYGIPKGDSLFAEIETSTAFS